MFQKKYRCLTCYIVKTGQAVSLKYVSVNSERPNLNFREILKEILQLYVEEAILKMLKITINRPIKLIFN